MLLWCILVDVALVYARGMIVLVVVEALICACLPCIFPYAYLLGIDRCLFIGSEQLSIVQSVVPTCSDIVLLLMSDDI
uniref:Uncharacterized protein n=1 Tax=Arundo donax TaxID=35708 RepID=A0A0A9GBP2_ARUDO